MISVTTVMERDISVRRILHTDQNDVWVYDGDKTLTLHDEQLVEKKKISVLSTLQDMVLTTSQDIIATESNKCLVKISPSGDVSTLCSTAPLEPGGICINNWQQMVVGLHTGLGTPPIKLVIYSPDGSTVLQEIENDEDGEPLFTGRITQVKQNGSGDYVVAESDRIVCVSCEGRFRWDYSDGPLTWVHGMVCDMYDNVIIAELYNNKIHLLSSEGKLVTTLLTREDGIRVPLSLSIDRHGQLWIGQGDSLKVVKYLE